MRRAFRHRWVCFLAPLLCAASLVLVAGCDTNSEADEQDFERFKGDWRVERLFVDGTDLTERLNLNYDSRLLFTFFTRDSERDRRFQIFARIDGQAQNFEASGNIDIDGGDDEMSFFPFDSSYGDFEVDYTFDRSDRITLTTSNDRDGINLRNILLPTTDAGGDDPDVRLIITAR